MTQAPRSICILRLSALGDVTHMLPVVRTLQKTWPETALTWIIGKSEANLIRDIEDIEFIEFDKKNSFKNYIALYQILSNKTFDVLLSAQISLRANIISLLIPARVKLGYDKLRSKDLHSLFINDRIHQSRSQHVLDSFFCFIEHLGIQERTLSWNYSITEAAVDFAHKHVNPEKFTVIISPCSSHPLRNWSSDRYAQVADFAIQQLNAQVLICGSPTPIETKMGEEIQSHMSESAVNLIGKDTIIKFLALLNTSDVLISPDSGPAHMAAGVGTPVIGLYAASNSRRSGPYNSLMWCVDKYDEAAKKFKNKSASELKWGTKLEYPGVMDLISTEEVIQKLKALYKEFKL